MSVQSNLMAFRVNNNKKYGEMKKKRTFTHFTILFIYFITFYVQHRLDVTKHRAILCDT